MLFGKSKRCIACGGTGGSDDQYVGYRIISNSNKVVGAMDVHKSVECFAAGSTIIRRQQEQAVDVRHIESSNTINKKKYTFALARSRDYFVIPLYEVPHGQKGSKYELRKDTSKFLKDFIDSDSVIMAYLRSLKGTPEAHIPMLVSVADHVIPRGVLDSDAYKRRKIGAIQQMRTSLDIRGHDRVQSFQIMHQYVQDTAILI